MREAAYSTNGAGPRVDVGSSVHPGWLSSEPRLDPALEAGPEAVRFAAFMRLVQTAGALDRAAVDALADLNLTAGAFGALLELEKVGDDGLAPSELARRLFVARRTATLYVEILTRQGWAERRNHPADRRMVLATLTPAGRDLLTNVGGAYRRRLAALMDDLSPIQAERLRQLLATISTDGSTRHHAEVAEAVAAE